MKKTIKVPETESIEKEEIKEEKIVLPDEIKKDPYNYICNWMESILPHTGRKVFEILSLMPVSLIIPDLIYMGKKIRTNINCLLLTPPGGAKCISQGTKIQMGDGCVKSIEKINKGDVVLSLNEKTLKIGLCNVKELIHQGEQEVYEILLYDGSKISVTFNHPFYTYSGWKMLSELKIGDLIACPRKIIRKYDPIYKFRDCEIKLLAYLLADGCIKNNVSFTNENKDILEEFEYSVKEFSDNLKIKKYDKKGNKAKQYKVSAIKIEKPIHKTSVYHSLGRNKLHQWLNSWGLDKADSYSKFIPDFVMGLEKSQISLFLNRLFACDGSIPKSKDRKNGFRYSIEYCSCSEKLIYGVKLLLLMLDIQTKIRKIKTHCNGKSFYSYKLSIRDVKNIKRFIRKIGFIKGKENRSLEILNIYKHPNTNRDIIPDEIKQDIIDYKKRNNIEWKDIIRGGWRKTKHLFDNHNLSRDMLSRLNIPQSKMYSESDIYWNKIVSIKRIGEELTFDLSIENSHNFVANNIFVHNSTCSKILSHFTYNPLEFRSITPAELENRISQNPFFTLIIEEFATMSKDPILIKIIEGIIGEEKRVQRATMRRNVDTETEGIALLAGVPSDLQEYLSGGLIFRVIPLVIFHNEQEHSEIGRMIVDGIGKNNQYDEKEAIVKEFYRELLRIQTGKGDIGPITGYFIEDKFKEGIYRHWDKVTKSIFQEKQTPLNWFRSLHEAFRIMVAHASLNAFNREIKDGIIHITEEDYKIAVKIMKRDLQTKWRVFSIGTFVRNITTLKELAKVMEMPTLTEEQKEIIKSMAKIKGKK